MSRPPKKHWMEMFEKKIEELEGKISDLEQHMTTLNLVAVLHSQIVAQFSLININPSATLENFDWLMGEITHLVQVIDESKKTIHTIPPESLMNVAINVAKSKDIAFQNLAPYLIEKLGKRLAKRIVEKETILRYYGEDAFTIWELLLQRGS